MGKKSYKVAEFVTAQEWIEAGRGGRQFDTSDKLDWFIRQHRDALIRSGELLPGRGARPSLIGPGFDALVVRILTPGTEAFDAQVAHDVYVANAKRDNSAV